VKPRKERAFRCVGGPHDGEMMTWSALVEEGTAARYSGRGSQGKCAYYAYNNAGYNTLFKMLYIWIEG
jgi:hypothetical protein